MIFIYERHIFIYITTQQYTTQFSNPFFFIIATNKIPQNLI